jgi:hypothetical protein
MTEGSITKNSKKEIDGMMEKLEKYTSSGHEHTLPTPELFPVVQAEKPDGVSSIFRRCVENYVKDADKWTKEPPMGNIQVWSRDMKGEPKAFKFELEMDCDVDSLQTLLHTDLCARHKEWNSTVVESGTRDLEKLGPDAAIQQWKYASGKVSDRLFVVAHRRFKDADGSITLIDRSVDHPSADDAAKTNSVMCKLVFNYRLLTPLPDGRTKFTYSNVTNIGGWIPTWMVNKANAGVSCEEIQHIVVCASKKA